MNEHRQRERRQGERRSGEQRQGERRQEQRPDYGPGGTLLDRRQGERRQGDRRVVQRRQGNRREPTSQAKFIALLQESIRDLEKLQLVATELLQQNGPEDESTAWLERTRDDARQAESQTRADLAGLIGSDE